jgi:hypothetical protein
MNALNNVIQSVNNVKEGVWTVFCCGNNWLKWYYVNFSI